MRYVNSVFGFFLPFFVSCASSSEWNFVSHGQYNYANYVLFMLLSLVAFHADSTDEML